MELILQDTTVIVLAVVTFQMLGWETYLEEEKWKFGHSNMWEDLQNNTVVLSFSYPLFIKFSETNAVETFLNHGS